LAQVIDFIVDSCGALMILLQRIDARHQGLGIRVIGLLQPGKQAFFLIGGVLGGGFAEVAEARRESSPVLFGERAPLLLRGQRRQHTEKTFDAAMAVSQHTDRVGKIAFAFGTNRNRH